MMVRADEEDVRSSLAGRAPTLVSDGRALRERSLVVWARAARWGRR